MSKRTLNYLQRFSYYFSRFFSPMYWSTSIWYSRSEIRVEHLLQIIQKLDTTPSSKSFMVYFMVSRPVFSLGFLANRAFYLSGLLQLVMVPIPISILLMHLLLTAQYKLPQYSLFTSIIAFFLLLIIFRVMQMTSPSL